MSIATNFHATPTSFMGFCLIVEPQHTVFVLAVFY